MPLRDCKLLCRNVLFVRTADISLSWLRYCWNEAKFSEEVQCHHRVIKGITADLFEIL